MRDVTEWIRGALANRREVKRRPPGNVVLGAVLHNIIAERADHGLLIVTDGSEQLIGGDDQPMHVIEDEPILFVGSATSPGHAEILDSIVRDITPHTRALRQARTRVKELATANHRKDEFLATLSHELRSPLASIQPARQK